MGRASGKSLNLVHRETISNSAHPHYPYNDQRKALTAERELKRSRVHAQCFDELLVKQLISGEDLKILRRTFYMIERSMYFHNTSNSTPLNTTLDVTAQSF